MSVYLILGLTYGFAAAVQPGPFTTYLVAQTVTHGWRRTLPAALSPLLSDGPIALLALLALSRVPPGLVQWLRILGGGFVLYLAVGAWRAWRRFDPVPGTPAGSARRGVLKAAVVNMLNPGPWLGWSLVLGPLVLKGWRESAACGLAVVAGFYLAMVGSLAGIILLAHGAGRVGPGVNRALVGVSAAALTGFGAYQLWLGVGGLAAR